MIKSNKASKLSSSQTFYYFRVSFRLRYPWFVLWVNQDPGLFRHHGAARRCGTCGFWHGRHYSGRLGQRRTFGDCSLPGIIARARWYGNQLWPSQCRTRLWKERGFTSSSCLCPWKIQKWTLFSKFLTSSWTSWWNRWILKSKELQKLLPNFENAG